MNEIGGFFGLELGSLKKKYHTNVVALNSGRNAFKYILILRKPQKVHIPYYICSSVVESLEELGVNYVYYYMNEKLEPNLTNDLEENDYLLYVNYFGINDLQVQRIVETFERVIIDNTQAFFSKPFKDELTFYSPRKFFGVADGGLAYIHSELDLELEQEVSFNKYEHLLKRIDMSAQESYLQFVKNEEIICSQPLKKMSKLTSTIMQHIDYEYILEKRKKNFKYVHSKIGRFNQLRFEVTNESVPMVYPLLIKKEGLNQFLINNNVYVATYWKEVLQAVREYTFEYELAKYLIPLPIDQRYDVLELDIMICLIEDFMGNLSDLE